MRMHISSLQFHPTTRRDYWLLNFERVAEGVHIGCPLRKVSMIRCAPVTPSAAAVIEVN